MKDAVLVRSSPSGVWMGRLVSRDATPDGTERVRLTDARRLWSWTGALSCSELALIGPTGGKICAPVGDVTVSQCCEVIAATDEAVAAVSRVTPWTR